MSQIIYKYPFFITDEINLKLPVGATIVDIALQDNKPCMWVMHEFGDPRDEVVTLRAFGTGHIIPEGLTFLKTLHMPPFVWHIFRKD